MKELDTTPDHGLGQAQKCGRVKHVNEITTLHLLIIGSLTTIQKKIIKKTCTYSLPLKTTTNYC